MLYTCATINIEYKWLCFGTGIYMGKGQGRAQFGIQPANMKDKPRWGQTGSWSEAALNSLPQTQLKLPPSLGRTGIVHGKKQWRKEV